MGEVKEIVIIGAGGFGREVKWLIERINESSDIKWQIKGFIDDSIEKETIVSGLKVIGNTASLLKQSTPTDCVCAVANPYARKKIIMDLRKNDMLHFPNLIDPFVTTSSSLKLGMGNIICCGSILTTDIEMGDFNHINLNCTIGHDTVLGSFNTLYPALNISGAVKIADSVEFGTGTKIIQGITICSGCTFGAGAVVIESIDKKGTYVGMPCKILEE